MLAYLFWHWSPPDADREVYEAALVDFHRSLTEQPPEGFHRSFVLEIRGAPWTPTGTNVYEDWYLVDDFAALGHLNEGATTGICAEPHREVARRSAGGSGAVYQLRGGRPALQNVSYALWFSKPQGVTYDEFYRKIPSTALAVGGGLWERQMVLGAAPECCLLAAEMVSLPHALTTVTLVAGRVWDGSLRTG